MLRVAEKAGLVARVGQVARGEIAPLPADALAREFGAEVADVQFALDAADIVALATEVGLHYSVGGVQSLAVGKLAAGFNVSRADARMAMGLLYSPELAQGVALNAHGVGERMPVAAPPRAEAAPGTADADVPVLVGANGNAEGGNVNGGNNGGGNGGNGNGNGAPAAPGGQDGPGAPGQPGGTPCCPAPRILSAGREPRQRRPRRERRRQRRRRRSPGERRRRPAGRPRWHERWRQDQLRGGARAEPGERHGVGRAATRAEGLDQEAHQGDAGDDVASRWGRRA